jgi:hypothetical protein
MAASLASTACASPSVLTYFQFIGSQGEDRVIELASHGQRPPLRTRGFDASNV